MFDGKSMWILNIASENVTQVSASNYAVLGTYSVVTQPDDIAFDGIYIGVANMRSDNLTLLRSSDGSLVKAIDFGGSPHFIEFNRSGMWRAYKADTPAVRIVDGLLSGERWFLAEF